MEHELQSIANRIKLRRNELRLSLQDLATATHMSKSTLQRYETGGIKNIPLNKLKDLADALQTSPEWIMGLGDKTNCSSDTELILQLFSHLNEQNRDKVLELAHLYLVSQDEK